MTNIYLGSNQFMDEVKKRSNGELEFKLLGGPEITSPMSLHKFTAQGMCDAMISAPAYYASDWPEGEAIDLIKPQDMRTWFRENMLNLYDEALQKKLGLKYVAMVQMPVPFYLLTTKKVVTTADWSGLKLRTPGGMVGEFMKNLGAATVTVASAEIITALQQGIVDGEMRTPDGCYAMKEYEYVKHTLNIPLINGATHVYMNLDAWNKLPPHLQKLLADVAKDVEPAIFDFCEKAKTDEMKEMVDKYGMQVHELAAGEQTKLRAAFRKTWDGYLAPQMMPGYAQKFDQLMAGHAYWSE